jgi:UDP-GlcNAc:undecaprenyl-phosphate/decaprenyl-phosphate GlcNAc-1-phosphate transferase
VNLYVQISFICRDWFAQLRVRATRQMSMSMIKLALPMLATIFFAFALRPLAFAAGLVNRPGVRKMHGGAIPLTGGLAIVGGLAITLLLGSYAEPYLPFFLGSVLILVTTGAIDDKFELSPAVRLCAQSAAVLVMIFGGGVVVSDLGQVFAESQASLGLLAVPFTVLITLAAINAFNMFDGSDGVAGGQALIGLAFLGAASLATGSVHVLPLIVAMAGCVFGFLCLNWPSKRTQRIRAFMGEAGSTTIGFALAWFSIALSQGEGPAFSPVVALWIFALPIFDLFTSIIRRVAAGRSPLSADADHLHHVLRRSGLSARQVAQLVLVASAMLSACGLVGHFAGIADGALFAGWLVLGAAYYIVFGSGLIIKRRRVPRVPVEDTTTLGEVWAQEIEHGLQDVARIHDVGQKKHAA